MFSRRGRGSCSSSAAGRGRGRRPDVIPAGEFYARVRPRELARGGEEPSVAWSASRGCRLRLRPPPYLPTRRRLCRLPDPVGRHAPDIDVVAAVDPGDDCRRRPPPPGERVDRLVEAAQLLKPPVDVLAAEAPGGASVTADRQEHPAPGLQQFVRDLAPRRAAADDEHRAVWQFLGPFRYGLGPSAAPTARRPEPAAG